MNNYVIYENNKLSIIKHFYMMIFDLANIRVDVFFVQKLYYKLVRPSRRVRYRFYFYNLFYNNWIIVKPITKLIDTTL